ncbi:MAG TPA: DUF933 domain-containing protein [Thermoleophilia bacterium]|nr:DUF933 domain-containing protein [Thermoleophilia bacterium]
MESRIIGLKGSGKSILLSALAEGRTDGTIATVRLADERIRRLSEIFKPKKTVYGEFTVKEAVWPDATARKGAMERYLDQIQGAQVFLHVVRAFESPMLADPADPARDLQELDEQFILSDLLAIERAFERARKAPLSDQAKKGLERARGALENDIPLREVEFEDTESRQLRSYAFLTGVSQLLLVNTDSGEDFDPESLGELAQDRSLVTFPFTEAAEVSRLSEEEQTDFAEAMGLPGPPTAIVTQAAFGAMGMISFFTVGEDEVRAWPIKRGTSAREAAGAVHSDIERGFIRAEVVGYDEFMERGSLKACKDSGVLRIEGKEYVVRDGEIVHYRFNV